MGGIVTNSSSASVSRGDCGGRKESAPSQKLMEKRKRQWPWSVDVEL
jgi:hypothetical protein